jgi:hypothetical protein
MCILFDFIVRVGYSYSQCMLASLNSLPCKYYTMVLMRLDSYVNATYVNYKL